MVKKVYQKEKQIYLVRVRGIKVYVLKGIANKNTIKDYYLGCFSRKDVHISQKVKL
ncbi:MAG: hypothetical protein ACUVQP_11635 [Bacteroidales bacterium]